jgi:pimeloyl-ACP methyl ester carboxylesterase
MSKKFVLVHGSWHGGWAWKDVICRLSEKGYGAHAPTLAGHGSGVTRLRITHQECVTSVVTYIQQLGLKNVALVGHSFGGSVVQKVAEQLPHGIARIVFLDALVLEDNQCALDILPTEFAALVNDLARASSDNKLPPLPASGRRTAGHEPGLRGPFARLGYLERLARYLRPPAPGRAASRTAGLLRLLGRLLRKQTSAHAYC